MLSVAVQDRQPEFDEPHMMDGDDMIGDAYGSGLQDELVEDPQDFDIPVAQMAEVRPVSSVSCACSYSSC